MSNECNYLTWKEFTDGVLGLLTVDEDRLGMENYRPKMIRQGVIDVQMAIPGYKEGHETVFQPNDFVKEGCASRGVKPPQAIIRDLYTCKALNFNNREGTKQCARFPVLQIRWEDRFAMITGSIGVNDGHARFCVDPQGYTFYVYPFIGDCWLFSMWWEGLKLDFQDEDQTPFDEPMMLCVAEFVKAKIARESKNDEQMYQSYMNSSIDLKRKLYVEWNSRR